MSNTYFERGGLRWGRRFWLAANATWPFATLRVSRDAVALRVGLWPLVRHFVLVSDEVVGFRYRRGLFSAGVQVEHRHPGYPPLLLFWTLSPRRLLSSVGELGYQTVSPAHAS